MLRPKKPTKGFPLWPHKNGSWCVVIDGERKAFGGWRTDPKGEDALRRYNAFIDDQAGHVGDSTTTVRDVVNRYLSHQHRRVVAKEIGNRNYGDAMNALEAFAAAVGKSSRVVDLRPVRFSRYRRSLADYSAPTIQRHIAHIKAAFRWAFDQELIIAPPRFGGDFKLGRVQSRRRKLLFTPEQIVSLIDSASDGITRAMVRLGIECGFGNTDVAALRWDEIEIDKQLITLSRHKTGADRKCAISTDLVNDLKEWKAVRDRRIEKAKVPILEPDLVFSTLRGLRFVREIPGEKPTDQPRTVDSVSVAFDKLARNKAKIKTAGDRQGFYTLRRTHRTWTDELGDHHAAALVMGHKSNDVASIYVQHIDDQRLFAINKHICDRITHTRTRLAEAARVAGAVVQRAHHAKGDSTRKPRGRAGRFARSGVRRQRKH